MRFKYLLKFNQLPIGCQFSLNGNQYRKRSTRTAEIDKPQQYAGTWFYFGQKELVLIRDGSLQAPIAAVQCRRWAGVPYGTKSPQKAKMEHMTMENEKINWYHYALAAGLFLLLAVDFDSLTFLGF